MVKNWVHNDRIGRIIISVNVAFESDLEQAREMLIAAAKAQDQVLKIPAPIVLFAEIRRLGAQAQAVCFVDDIEFAERTRSDINFDILRRMREAGLRIPYPALGRTAPTEVRARGPQPAAVRPASQPMIACLRARPQW